MDIWTLTLTAFLVGFSGAIVPGSLMTLVVNYSLSRGFFAGIRTIIGHAILELALLFLLVLGIGDFFSKPAVVLAISFCGGAVLVWMGYDMIRGAGKINLEFAAANLGKRRLLTLPELGGALLSATNPYWILWWATVGVTYLSFAKKYGLTGFGALYFGHISADFAWYGFLAALLVRGRKHINQTVYRCILICCGVFLLFLAGYFILSSRKYWALL